MKVGEKIKFNFAGKQKEGVIHKLFPNSVHMKVDFAKDKGKIVKRKLNEPRGGDSTSGKKSKKK